MPTRRPFLVVLFAAACAASQPVLSEAPPLAAAVSARLAEHPVVVARFSQVKTLAAMSRPVKSSGRLVFARDRGTVWQIESPVQMTFVIGDDRTTEIAPDGRRRTASASDSPSIAEASRVLRALIAGDRRTVEEQFAVSAAGTAARWELTLAPKPRLAAFLKVVRVAGGAFVEEIVVEEASGDHTRLRFEQHQSSAALGDADARLFGQR